MDNDENLKVVKRIEDSIEKIRSKNFKVFFFIMDAKNHPDSELEYIYNIAKSIYDKGYDVNMLYQLENEYTEAEKRNLEKEGGKIDEDRMFIGVGEWLGKDYMEIPHMNVSTEEWTVSAADILFIPEVFSSLMFQTYKSKVPCKRVVIVRNTENITRFIPVGVEWKDYGIFHALVATKKQEEYVNKIFPYVNTDVLSPSIHPIFRKPLESKFLFVNVICKDEAKFNYIVKTFYWQYPIYKFIPFINLKKCSLVDFSQKLRDGAITIWIDENTEFGTSGIEAIKANSILIGLIPSSIPEWMLNEDGNINNSGFWTYSLNQIPNILSEVIGTWMQDEIPETVQNDMKSVSKLYSIVDWDENISEVMNGIMDSQIDVLNEIKSSINKDLKKETND